MRTKQEAEREGKKLLKRMKGKGWKLRVHENIGWHYNVWNGPAAVYPSVDGMFHCLLADRDCEGTGCGNNNWTTNFHSKDPNEVVEHEVASARAFLKQCNRQLQYIEEALGGK